MQLVVTVRRVLVRTGRRGWLLGALVLAVAVVGVGTGVERALSHQHLHTPATLAGQHRDVSALAAGRVAALRGALTAGGAGHSVAALYGSAGHPAFVVAGGDVGSAAHCPACFRREFLRGITAQDPTFTLTPSPADPAELAGSAELQCGATSSSTVGMAAMPICVWSDDAVAGVVVGKARQSLTQAAALTRRVRAEAEHR